MATSTMWHETFAMLGSESDTIKRGLTALEGVVSKNAQCVLHGWIDQAALEIVSIGKFATLRERAVNYRADQGGDTGILALDNGWVTVLEFRFEAGEAKIHQYQLAEQVSDDHGG